MVWLVVVCGVFGLVIGSFLNVVIWRVPRGESIVESSVGLPEVRTRDPPVRQRPGDLSWLVLRGKCRDCGNPISARYPLVEFGTGVLFGAMAWRFGFALGAAGLPVLRRARRRPGPDRPGCEAPAECDHAAVLRGRRSCCCCLAVFEGQWEAYLYAWVGALILFGLYFLLAFIYPAGMGFGDVKLAGVIGLYLGWLGWGVWPSGPSSGSSSGPWSASG